MRGDREVIECLQSSARKRSPSAQLDEKFFLLTVNKTEKLEIPVPAAAANKNNNWLNRGALISPIFRDDEQ
jgi:hypothetical protein